MSVNKGSDELTFWDELAQAKGFKPDKLRRPSLSTDEKPVHKATGDFNDELFQTIR